MWMPPGAGPVAPACGGEAGGLRGGRGFGGEDSDVLGGHVEETAQGVSGVVVSRCFADAAQGPEGRIGDLFLFGMVIGGMPRCHTK